MLRPRHGTEKYKNTASTPRPTALGIKLARILHAPACLRQRCHFRLRASSSRLHAFSQEQTRSHHITSHRPSSTVLASVLAAEAGGVERGHQWIYVAVEPFVPHGVAVVDVFRYVRLELAEGCRAVGAQNNMKTRKTAMEGCGIGILRRGGYYLPTMHDTARAQSALLSVKIALNPMQLYRNKYSYFKYILRSRSRGITGYKHTSI